MPFDGSGNYVRSFPAGGWQGDASSEIKITAARHDQHDTDLATALSLCLLKDGQSSPTADINWNAKKITNLGAPTAGTDAATKTYVDAKQVFSGSITVGGSHPNAQVIFSGTTGPWGNSFVTADMASGVRGTDWVWNDKADFSGTDLMKLTKASLLTLKSITGGIAISLNAAAGAFATGIIGLKADKYRWTMYLGNNSAESTGNAGSDFQLFRYNDDGTGAAAAMFIDRSNKATSFYGALTIAGSLGGVTSLSATGSAFVGSLTSGGAIYTAGSLIQSGSVFYIGGDSACSIYLRPVYNSATNQSYMDTAGAWTFGGSGTFGGLVTSSQSFVSSSATVMVAPTGASAQCYIRPFGIGSNTEQLQYNYLGNLYIGNQGYKATAGDWAAASDARIKTVTGDYEPGLAEIVGLQIRRFMFNGADATKHIVNDEEEFSYPHAQLAAAQTECVGLIAQEAELVMPDLVQQIEAYIDNQPVSDFRILDTTNITYALVNAVKELASRVEALEAA